MPEDSRIVELRKKRTAALLGGGKERIEKQHARAS